MEWNEGLRHWTRMRDVWSGARTVEEVEVVREAQVQQGEGYSRKAETKVKEFQWPQSRDEEEQKNEEEFQRWPKEEEYQQEEQRRS